MNLICNKISVVKKNLAGAPDKLEKILDDISFSLKQNEVIALCGPNGSGKSTLLKILAGIEKDFQGQLVQMNEGGMEQAIAYVPAFFFCQQPFSVATVVEIHKFEYSKNGQILDQLSENRLRQRLRIQELLPKNVHILSSGESKRLAIFLGLLKNPGILLLDEPDANCDPDVIEEIFQYLHGLKNVMIILVTHQLNLALHYARRFLILNHDHRLIFDGPNNRQAVATLRRLYKHSLTSVQQGKKTYLVYKE